MNAIKLGNTGKSVLSGYNRKPEMITSGTSVGMLKRTKYQLLIFVSFIFGALYVAALQLLSYWFNSSLLGVVLAAFIGLGLLISLYVVEEFINIPKKL